VAPDNQYVIIISGPTGVGKSDVAESFAQRIGGAIINADVGQLYAPLSIGTAKPALDDTSVPHYLFNYINEPQHFSVAAYREAVIEKIHMLWRRNIVPVIVGGSLFYINSLFFPPSAEQQQVQVDTHEYNNASNDELWHRLYAIDPERAHELNPADRYRVERALAIWDQTGTRPSRYKPTFSPVARACIMFLHRDRQELYDRINRRVVSMFDEGWEREVAELGQSWHTFLEKKRFIGYPDILSYIQNRDISKHELIDNIQQKTRKYAKRQMTYWRSFERRITAEKIPPIDSPLVLTCNVTSESKQVCMDRCWHALQQWDRYERKRT
jgi:tRNA dimethylallyltransferase